MYKIGFSSCCFPSMMAIEDIIDFCIHHNFNAMELEVNDTNFSPKIVKSSTLNRIKKLIKEENLVMSLHSPGNINLSDHDLGLRADSESNVCTSIEWGAELGVETVVVHPGRVVGDFNQENWNLALDQNIRAFKRFAQLANSLGVIVSIENLCHEKGSVNPVISDFFEMCSRIGLATIRMTLDTNHAALVDGLEKTVQTIGPYVNHIHFSSNKGVKSDHCEPREGVIDFYSMKDYLVSFTGMIIIELNESGSESADTLLRTRDYLYKLLNIT